MVKMQNVKEESTFQIQERVARRPHHKIKWTLKQDTLLLKLIQKFGPARWSKIAKQMPSRRGKQCRQRWHNHLNPTVNKGYWELHQEWILFLCFLNFETKWATMSYLLPGRTDNNIKNHWNSIMRKKLFGFNEVLKDIFPHELFLRCERQLLIQLFCNNFGEGSMQQHQKMEELMKIQHLMEQLTYETMSLYNQKIQTNWNQTTAFKSPEIYTVKEEYQEAVSNVKTQFLTKEEANISKAEQVQDYQCRRAMLEQYRLFYKENNLPIKIQQQNQSNQE